MDYSTKEEGGEKGGEREREKGERETTLPEMRQNLRPIRGVIKPPQIRLQLPCQDLERRALARPILPDQPQNLPWPRHGQSVKLEGIRAITMCL